MLKVDFESLQIGDWVLDRNGFTMQVVAVAETWCRCDFKGNEADPWEYDRRYPLYGIPLTEEICELNGWKDGLICPHCRLTGFESGCVAVVDEDRGDSPIVLADVRTVDQLQRYLRTQGTRGAQIAKTIKI